MKDNNYSKQIKVTVNSEKVFHALNEGLNIWWGKTSNTTYVKGGQFTITFENGYWWTFKIIEYSPNKELIWKCVDGEPLFNKEWIGHILYWSIDGKNNETTINFHQTGLNPEIHCYEVCSKTWDMFISENLKKHLENLNDFA